MCLSVPSKVVEIHDDATVTVDTLGVKRRVSCHLICDPLVLGDFVLIHIGFVMNKIDHNDAQESLDLYQQIVAEMELESEQ
ncbi:HypC/HybG/HupF family hydrogenase formation chaperone [Shewanella sp. SG44-2]|uniref:HypC/HybG/HupF family hydrogenase formation chaperone n=1 Tax=Shewanella sp. SG44-2 TaxID=2760962 RepID=UPI0016048B9C|nr:HypC/HybG/HupF family hydrogenase formation chaperone [Shewanella sp. SG44-2]MBB1424906.1 HypC/HybG/HupF family hydrogenase formation chaperone [Shewanella sp. SG44-2]|tara:strand:- start:6330 stop:6572 length:243 start_codon:yes stop_codon:yes gene_type:complete